MSENDRPAGSVKAEKRRPLSGILDGIVRPPPGQTRVFEPRTPPTPPRRETDSELLLSIRNWVRILGTIWILLLILGGIGGFIILNSIENAGF